jgi:hypothetical protein
MEGTMKISEAVAVLTVARKEIQDMTGLDPDLSSARMMLADMGRTPDGEISNTFALEMEEMLKKLKIEL